MDSFNSIYLKDLKVDNKPLATEISTEVKSKLDFLKSKFNIPDDLYQLYLKNDSLQSSIVINGIYHSIDLEEMFQLREHYPHFIDFFWKYMGMGHMEFISYCVHTGLFFKRMGGGSSGHEKEYNYLQFKDYKLGRERKSYTFEEVLELLKDEEVCY